MDKSYATLGAGQQSIGPPMTPAPKPSPMQHHANTLHDQASRLQALNAALSKALDRLNGMGPESATDSKDQPSPNGTLMVAAFGAERIHLGLDRLQELVSRLEQTV